MADAMTNDGPNLEIETVWMYYDAPICGVARIGEQRLYYTWTGEGMIEFEGREYKRRFYTAYVMDPAEWKILERSNELDHIEDLTPEQEQEDAALNRLLRAMHDQMGQDETLPQRPGVLGFSSDMRLRWPSYE